MVTGPDLASLHGLSFGHLRCAYGPIHEVPEYPDTDETGGDDDYQQGAQSRNTEEDLELVAGGDDQQGEIHNDQKRLAKVETILLSKEELSPSRQPMAECHLRSGCRGHAFSFLED